MLGHEIGQAGGVDLGGGAALVFLAPLSESLGIFAAALVPMRHWWVRRQASRHCCAAPSFKEEARGPARICSPEVLLLGLR